MKKRFIFLFVLSLLVVMPMSAKNLKMGKTIFYSGDIASDKTPEGEGMLVMTNQPSKSTLSDTIWGDFVTYGDTIKINRAKAHWSNGAKFEGQIMFAYKIVSAKPVEEHATLIIDGDLIWPDEPERIGKFTLHRTTQCANYLFELALDSIDSNLCRTQLGTNIWYQGELIGLNTPKGKGKLCIMNDKDTSDVLAGEFDSLRVKDATLMMKDIQCSIVGEIDMTYEIKRGDVAITYVAAGKMLNGEKALYEGDSLITIQRHIIDGKTTTDSIVLTDFFPTEKSYLKGLARIMELPDSIRAFAQLVITVDKDQQLKTDIRTIDGESYFLFPDGGSAGIHEGKYTITLSDGTTFVYDEDENQIKEFTKTYTEGFMHYVPGGKCTILYKDGARYEGTLELRSNDNIFSAHDQYATYIQPKSIGDFWLIYKDGEETLPNGNKDVWKDGITESQRNKLNDNYDEVLAAAATATVQDNQPVDIHQQWEEVRPELEKEFGEDNVKKLYSNQLEKGMPLELFLRVKELKLPYFNLIGPFAVEGTGGAYVIEIKNPETGEAQPSQVLKFSTANILTSVSNNF